MRNTMTNLWHFVGGVQISNLGERIYLFNVFHEMDIKWVINWASWTYPLVRKDEDPIQVLLIFSAFWIQVCWGYNDKFYPVRLCRGGNVMEVASKSLAKESYHNE
ncbi:hypothetical protein CXB51_026337 [Gossypium anomalum]|uniref:DUF4283 domain-containing protein n=1 Tax=Gossypium anomalum TaxID=47600 RepID=A0A8J5YS39_9ROSI|nr:hypothetical protein CXB51_026337 [Gossypium anomalum]